MTEQESFPPLYRIRGKSGPLAGNWLWMMTVTKNGVPFQVMNWEGVSQHPEQYSFYPQFIPSESAAFLAISRKVAESFVRILASNGFDCEVIEVASTSQ
jgi:hypothetical protein